MRAGLRPADVWSLTPREVALHVQGARYRERQQVARGLSIAWHVAAFSRSPGRLPDLQQLIAKVTDDPGAPRPPVRQTIEQQKLAMLMWVGLTKGEAERESRRARAD